MVFEKIDPVALYPSEIGTPVRPRRVSLNTIRTDYDGMSKRAWMREMRRRWDRIFRRCHLLKLQREHDERAARAFFMGTHWLDQQVIRMGGLRSYFD